VLDDHLADRHASGSARLIQGRDSIKPLRGIEEQLRPALIHAPDAPKSMARQKLASP
jgi:hypothetical protein